MNNRVSVDLRKKTEDEQDQKGVGDERKGREKNKKEAVINLAALHSRVGAQHVDM